MDFLTANQAFLQNIAIDVVKEKAHELIIMIGSNRQDQGCDAAGNAKFQTGSCYPRIIELCEYLKLLTQSDKCRVDKFLMADLYGNVEAGHSFGEALQSLTNQYPSTTHKRWTFDHSKMTLIYAQIQKIASENPTATITYDFYDDIRHILSTLKDFFFKDQKC